MSSSHPIQALILNNAGHAHSHGGGGGDHGHSHGKGGGENVNIRSAYIHVLGDAAQSVGVMIAAALIWYEPAWRIADPICTFVFSIIVLYTTVQVGACLIYLHSTSITLC
jgi:zinc transporter 2